MEDFFDNIRSVDIFDDLNDDDVRIVGQYCRLDRYRGQELVFSEGDEADRFYIVRSGKIEVWKNRGRPDAALLAIKGPGHVFGEMALIDDLPRSATVLTHGKAELVSLGHSDFARLLTERPAISKSILRCLSAIVRKSNEQYIESLNEQNQQMVGAYQELKTAQDELLQAERFGNLGKFASFILHDLRNPIAMIKGFAEMILLDEDLGQIRQFATKIIQESEQVNLYANEILDYSRGDIRLNYVLTTVDHLFARIRNYLGDSFSRRRINLEFRNACQVPVMIDEDRLLRALVNIVDNARKACRPEGSVAVAAEHRDAELRLTVSDDGEGMGEDVRLRVFEPFFSNSKQGGTGLGLLIAKNVVEAHQGRISLSSELGKGTTFTIVMPVQPDSEPL